jgi:TonB-linked SusC/RagA family outer membrane protein
MTKMQHVRGVAAAVFAALLAVPAAVAGAQSATITGRVASETGVRLEGANVLIPELSASAVTNSQGAYTIVVPSARVSGQRVVVRVRAIGYTPESRTITLAAGNSTEDFTLKADINRLSEVVVTGTVGEATERSKVPFAVARLTAADIPVPALDPVTALSGKVAGLRIAQTGGQPGTSPQIQLRGPTSINTNGRSTSPLIVVDGVIMNVGSLTEIGGLDIESIEVVKGAAGASLYGTRAANGVIQIKTRRGGAGSDAIRFNFQSEYGVSDLNSITYGMPLYNNLTLDETGSRICVQPGSLGTPANYPNCARSIDWMKEVMRINNLAGDTVGQANTVQGGGGPTREALLNNYQASYWPNQYFNPLAQTLKMNPIALTSLDATGKVSSVRFFVSGSYQNQQGAIRDLLGNKQRRARVNLDYDARSDLNFSVSSMYDRGDNDNRSGGSSSGGIFGQVLRGAAIGTDYLARDTLGRRISLSPLATPSGNGVGTLLYDMENLFDVSQSNRFFGNISSRYFPVEWLTVDGTYGYDSRQRVSKSAQLFHYRTQGISTSQNSGNMQFGNVNDIAMNGTLGATIRHQFRSDLNSTFQLRGNFDQEDVLTNSSGGQVFNVSGVFTTSNTTTQKTATSSSQLVKNRGVLAGTSFDFKDRYVVDLAMRYDGSSLFGAGNRWAPFGRVSGVWRVSEEPFYNVPGVTDFRIRASHGTAGSTPQFSAQYETFNCSATGCSLGQAGNLNLKPETTTENEVGAEFTLMSRLGVELTNARSQTKNQILPVSTPAAAGFTTQWQNAGTLANNTYEVALNLPITSRRDFSWSMRGTWDRTRTTVKELFVPDFFTDGGTGQGSGTFFLITAKDSMNNGQPMNRFGQIYGREFYRSCGELPGTLPAECGDVGSGKSFQVNDKGYVVWVGPGNDYTQGITKNLWQTFLPAAQSPWGPKVPLFFGMPIVDRPLAGQPNAGIGFNKIIGNVFPDFRMTYSNNITYKRLTFYGLLDATIGQSIYNQGEQWGLLDLSSANFDQRDNSVQNAKPIGYGWRTGPSESTGVGGFYDTLNPNNYNVEDGSFAKIRELSLTYNIGKVKWLGESTVGFVGRNIYTFTNYTGLDPEVGAGGGSGSTSSLVNSTDAFGFPNLRNYTLRFSTRF